MRFDGQRHAPAASPTERDPLPIVQGALWAPEPVWTCVKNLAVTVMRSPDLSARSKSLYRVGELDT